MSLDAYKVFCTVVEKKNFLRAAETLHLTPSAVSYSIARLEDKFGLLLFFREKNGVRLTQEGEDLLAYVKAILDDQSKLQKAISHLKGIESGTVRIGTFNSACVQWMPGIMQSFGALYPQVIIRVYQGSCREVTQWLQDGTIQMAFLPSQFAEGQESILLHRDRMMVVVPKGYQPKNNGHISLEELQEADILCRQGEYGAENDLLLKKLGLRAVEDHYIQDDRSLLAMVACGFGFTILPQYILGHVGHHLQVYPLLPVEYRDIVLAKLPKQTLLPAAKNMFEHIVDYLHHNGDCVL